ncbi:MAG TPA: DUF1579 family protein [Gemmatimonadales bacterium]|nr:DUF1579 family protein [Gemmatimonadales bacterium]
MSKAGNRRAGYLGISVVVLAAATGPALVAQGGPKVARPAGSVTTASGESSRLERARAVLGTLVGTWRFEIWFAGNFTNTPDAAGMRHVTTLFDDLRLEWTENLDHSPIETRGLIAFDPKSGRFFSSSVSSAGPAPVFMLGTVDNTEPLVIFRPLADSTDQSFAVTMLDADHFRTAALDRSWRALFTRQP